MLSKFSMNALIWGDADYYCLICEDRFKTVESINAHIEKAVHKKKLEESLYAKNFENEGIRKLDRGYYCEYCNIILTTSLKISFHVKQKKHEYNKSDDVDEATLTKYAQWHDNCVIVFDDLLVKENAWNGLIDNSCAICNVEFENEELHKTERNHIVNLIQAQLLVGDTKSIYRKIDSQTFHCITCNEVLPLPVESHFEQDYHVECYIKCRRDRRALQNNMSKEKTLEQTQKKMKIDNGNETKITEEKFGAIDIKTSEEETSKTTKIDNINETVTMDEKIDAQEIKTTKDETPEQTPKEIKVDSAVIMEKKNEVNESNVTKTSKEKTIKLTMKTDGNVDEEKKIDEKISSEISVGGNCDTVELEPIDALAQKLKLKDYIYIDANRKAMCVLCEWELPHATTSIRTHIQSQHHQELLKLHRENIERKKQTIKKGTQSTTNIKKGNGPNKVHITGPKITLKRDDTETENTSKQNDNRTEILYVLTDLQKHRIYVDFINEYVICKKCDKTLPFELNDINKHIDEHEKTKSKDCSLTKDETDGTKLFTRPVLMAKKKETRNGNPTTNVDGEKDVIAFATENHINYNHSPNQAYCRMCQSVIPKALVSIREHVKGARHTRNAPEKNPIMPIPPATPKLDTKIFDDFFETLKYFNDLVIVDKYVCINKNSFNMITVTGGDMRCHLCEMSFERSALDHHLNSDVHEERIANVPTLVSEYKEFLRIPKDGIFHCGYCDTLLNGWSDVQTHVKSSIHCNKKSESEKAAKQNLPRVLEEEERQDALIKRALRNAFGRSGF